MREFLAVSCLFLLVSHFIAMNNQKSELNAQCIAALAGMSTTEWYQQEQRNADTAQRHARGEVKPDEL